MLKNATKSQQRTTPRLKAYLHGDYKNKFSAKPRVHSGSLPISPFSPSEYVPPLHWNSF